MNPVTRALLLREALSTTRMSLPDLHDIVHRKGECPNHDNQGEALTEHPELWNTTEVAKFLGVEHGTVSAYRHRRQMPAPVQTVGTHTHLWDADVIRKWQEGRKKGKKQNG